MNTRNMLAPRRCDTNWPQTIQLDRRRAPRTKDNPYRRRPKRKPLVDWSNPLEVGGVIAACIGIAVVIVMWVGLLL